MLPPTGIVLSIGSEALKKGLVPDPNPGSTKWLEIHLLECCLNKKVGVALRRFLRQSLS